MDINELATFGDQRRMILDMICKLNNGDVGVNHAMAFAANMKVLNESVQTEINWAKTAMAAKAAGHDFGKIVSMGQKRLGRSGDLPSEEGQ
jgi:hypothetical protein